LESGCRTAGWSRHAQEPVMIVAFAISFLGAALLGINLAAAC
jgi:hypothetical protein